MKPNRIPSLALAAVLQIVPVCRVATVNPAIAPTTFAIVVRCAAAIAALLGSVDAVSGASAPVFVAGVQSLLPSVPGVTTNITRPTGSPIVLRIILGGGVGQQPQLDYFNAIPLPPGLMINTNVNTNSVGLESTNYFIYGTPTQAGTWFPVTVAAGNLLYAGLAATNIIITITNASGVSPPAITTQPQSRTVTNGSNATFQVVATGIPPPTYQWRFNGTPLAGATASSLTISNAQPANDGDYSVVVSNSVNTVTSASAHLTVLYSPVFNNVQMEVGKLAFDVSGPPNVKVVILSSTDLGGWMPLCTNVAPSGAWHFLDSNSPPAAARFYRGLLQP